MSFSSRRRNYMLVSHRRDQFIEFTKGLLQPSFVLDALAESAGKSWRHIEELVDEHREVATAGGPRSRLAEAVPTIGVCAAAWRLARRVLDGRRGRLTILGVMRMAFDSSTGVERAGQDESWGCHSTPAEEILRKQLSPQVPHAASFRTGLGGVRRALPRLGAPLRAAQLQRGPRDHEPGASADRRASSAGVARELGA